MNIQEAASRCRAMCGAEAVEMGFPAELGYTIHDDSIRHDVEGWTDDEFLLWVESVSSAFQVKDWQPLYLKVADLMAYYAKLVKT